ncbi:uncharacterized protein LOC144713165 [Wolffia australiana]
MESVYRMWLRERNEEHRDYVFLDIPRELQIALDTAKWQLEEFERAVRESHNRRPTDKIAIARHTQFIQVISEQIDQVQNALGETLIKEGKEPLRWIHLNEDERNDLALFLSPPSPPSKSETSFHEARADNNVAGANSLRIDMNGTARISQRTKVMSGEKRESFLENLKEGVIAHLAEKEHHMHLKRPVRTTVLVALALLLVASFVLYSS